MKPAVTVKLKHTSVGCNQVAGCLDWGSQNLIAYGAHNQTVIYDTQAAAVRASLIGHTGRVNCVKWLPDTGEGVGLTLATGSADQTVNIWRIDLDNQQEPWRLLTTLKEHQGPVVSLAAQQLTDLSSLLVSSAGDSHLCVWHRARGMGKAWTLRQTLSFGIQLQLCADVTQLPHRPGWLLLACGGVDSCIRLLLCEPGTIEFRQACKLSGHQDWVRSVAFRPPDAADATGRLLLASASQDKNIRIWAILPEDVAGDAAGAAPVSRIDSEQPMLPSVISRYAPRPRLQAGDAVYTAVLESVLVGHEDWVHSVTWQPRLQHGGSGGAAQLQSDQAASLAQQTEGTAVGAEPAPSPQRSGVAVALTPQPCLLSASMDRTMMLWRPDAATGLWMSEESVGDAGASHLGYFSGRFSPHDGGASIAANGYTGALHMWRRSGGSGKGHWVPQHAAGGHFGAVMDMAWGWGDSCLLTVGQDQTARVFASLPSGSWCEIARPQVHGHDFAAVAVLPERDAYASASEEKVVRIMQAPQVFFDTQALLCGRQQAGTDGTQAGRALGGAVAALGLSQKAVYADDDPAPAAEGGGFAFNYASGCDLAPNPAPSASAEPPLEEHLCQNTLWPEIRKLFGHDNNLQALTASGGLLASASESKTADLADIWLWDTQAWACRGRLAAHSLSVTQLAFSHNGEYLLSGSRDRTYAVFRRRTSTAKGDAPFELVAKVKAHQRMVLGVSWAPSDTLFATGSRDNSVKLWAISSAGPAKSASTVLSLPAAVTSLSFAPASSGEPSVSRTSHLAIGLDSGAVQVWRVTEDASVPAGDAAVSAECVWQTSKFEMHAALVHRMRWRLQGDAVQLATCSADHAVKLFETNLT